MMLELNTLGRTLYTLTRENKLRVFTQDALLHITRSKRERV